MIATAFMLIAEACGRKYGSPLPKKILELEDAHQQWRIRFNPTDSESDGIEPFTAHITWGAFPAGIITANSGNYAASEAANEDSLLDWLTY